MFTVYVAKDDLKYQLLVAYEQIDGTPFDIEGLKIAPSYYLDQSGEQRYGTFAKLAILTDDGRTRYVRLIASYDPPKKPDYYQGPTGQWGH